MRISDWSSDVCSTDLVQSVSRPCVVPFVVVGEGAVSRSACGLAGACRSTSEEGSSTWPSHHPSAHRRSWRRCCLRLQPEPAFFRARSPLGTGYGHACHWDCRGGRSEGRSVGEGGVRSGRCWGSPDYHKKTKQTL